jgi:cytochrome oxidase Cu insertion factor (SCO1/SenC/PrrC family)
MSPRALSRLRWLTLLLAAVVIGLQVAAYFATRPTAPMVHSGQADIGAPFSLTDHLGRPVSDQSLRGRTIVLYFGWARDPDLTPAALQLLSGALDRLGRKGEAVTPVFITLDPERDSISDLRTFVARFHSRLVGLIGSRDQTDALVRAFKLYVARIPDAALPGGYSVDHASLYYVLGPDGRFRGLVPHTTDVVALAGELESLTKKSP